MSRKIIIGLFILLALISPRLFPAVRAAQDLKITLQEEMAIGSLEDDLLFQWAGVAVDGEGMIYVTDTLEYTVKKFDQEGHLLEKAGRKGQGPGEFMAPRFIACTREWVYVTDQEKRGIQVFDKDLRFVRGIPLSLPVSDLKVIDDDTIALATVSYGTPGQIFFVDSRGRVVRTVSYGEQASAFMMDMVDFAVDASGALYLVYSFQDKIERRDPEGKKVWSRQILNRRRVSKRNFGDFEVPTEVIYKDVALDPQGNIYVLGGHHSKNRSRDVYVLDREGNHLASFVLPEPSHCLIIDSQGYLYSRANDGVTLKKYKLIY